MVAPFVGDVAEQRRDVAEKALFRFSDGEHGRPPLPNFQAQRTSPIRDAVGRMMRKASGPAPGGAKIPATGGAPLDSSVRGKLEPKLGADLSGVRVHTGGQSETAAASYGARAFTLGNDVHFGKGEFSPGTKEGDRLLGHELTHVVQGQKSGVVQRKAEDGAGGTEEAEHEVSDPSEPAEKEADEVGDHVADSLHEAKASKGKAGASDEKDHDGKNEKSPEVAEKAAPKIAAKLEGVGRKVFLARPARDPATPRDDVRPIPGSAKTQNEVEIKIKPDALQHILGVHTVENFDPVARLPEVGTGIDTSLFPPGFATNAQELVTVVKQPLGNKAAKDFDPADRQLSVTIKKVKFTVWVGPVGKSSPGVYMLNTVHPVGGVSLKATEVKKYADDIKAKRKTIQQIRTELLGRFK